MIYIIAYIAFWVLLAALIIRAAFLLVNVYATTWVPVGPFGILGALQMVSQTISDVPLRLLSRIPMLKIGHDMRVDVRYIVLVLICSIMLTVLKPFAF